MKSDNKYKQQQQTQSVCQHISAGRQTHTHIAAALRHSQPTIDRHDTANNRRELPRDVQQSSAVPSHRHRRAAVDRNTSALDSAANACDQLAMYIIGQD